MKTKKKTEKERNEEINLAEHSNPEIREMKKTIQHE
jgi:hypothetical protein